MLANICKSRCYKEKNAYLFITFQLLFICLGHCVDDQPSQAFTSLVMAFCLKTISTLMSAPRQRRWFLPSPISLKPAGTNNLFGLGEGFPQGDDGGAVGRYIPVRRRGRRR